MPSRGPQLFFEVAYQSPVYFGMIVPVFMSKKSGRNQTSGACGTHTRSSAGTASTARSGRMPVARSPAFYKAKLERFPELSHVTVEVTQAA